MGDDGRSARELQVNPSCSTYLLAIRLAIASQEPQRIIPCPAIVICISPISPASSRSGHTNPQLAEPVRVQRVAVTAGWLFRRIYRRILIQRSLGFERLRRDMSDDVALGDDLTLIDILMVGTDAKEVPNEGPLVSDGYHPALLVVGARGSIPAPIKGRRYHLATDRSMNRE